MFDRDDHFTGKISLPLLLIFAIWQIDPFFGGILLFMKTSPSDCCIINSKLSEVDQKVHTGNKVSTKSGGTQKVENRKKTISERV